MDLAARLKNRTVLLCVGAGFFTVFGLCGLYLTKIEPLGPCASGSQVSVLLLGIVSFCLGSAALLSWLGPEWYCLHQASEKAANSPGASVIYDNRVFTPLSKGTGRL
jgi:hypothetical protein